MHKSDIDRLEDYLTNQEKYKQYLKLREFELSYKEDEPAGKIVNNNAQDQRTIKSGSVTSTVELEVVNKHQDLKYQTLYRIVKGTEKFIGTLNEYEKLIYNYRYCESDLSVFEWEDIAMRLTDVASKHNKSFSKSTTLRLRNKMLERLAEYTTHITM